MKEAGEAQNKEKSFSWSLSGRLIGVITLISRN